MCEEQSFLSLETMYLSKKSCRDIERGDSWFEEVESISEFFFSINNGKTIIYKLEKLTKITEL